MTTSSRVMTLFTTQYNHHTALRESRACCEEPSHHLLARRRYVWLHIRQRRGRSCCGLCWRQQHRRSRNVHVVLALVKTLSNISPMPVGLAVVYNAILMKPRRKTWEGQEQGMSLCQAEPAQAYSSQHINLLPDSGKDRGSPARSTICHRSSSRPQTHFLWLF